LDVCDPVLMAARPFRCLRRLPKQRLHEIDAASGRRRPRRRPAAPASGEESSSPASPTHSDGGGGSLILGTKLSERGQVGPDSPSARRLHRRNHEPLSLETRLQLVLQQGARKPYEPQAELLQTKMNVIFVSFFVAVMPYGTIGALVTLAAKSIELKCNLSKLVFVRRRVFAKPDRAMRHTQRNFVIALAAGIPAWSAMLSLITYNENLFEWSSDLSKQPWEERVWSNEPKDFIIRLVIIWLALAAIFFVTSNAHWLNWKRWVIIVIFVPVLWLAIDPNNTVGDHKGKLGGGPSH